MATTQNINPAHQSLLVFLQPYQPAYNEIEATEIFSTLEIMASLEQHHGGLPLINSLELVSILRRLGFKDINLDGRQIVWLFKKAESCPAMDVDIRRNLLHDGSNSEMA